ncbi:MarR family winged helix-turn-helix transcriptional regulator [Candidatus Raskinella chloraquaticus]|uniref:HTH marR-type domain-containing protein n=1 Tax=Candidatus Raskinella chloraquaticus TaxID=1951219 RepID=A0A1W9HSG7_9HYPH|nr:MAG: hypothetical protein A4S15_00855 [Proteobacteria bacterium SG_bin8]
MAGSFEKSVSFRLAHVAKLHRARAAALLAEIHLYPGQETVLKSLAAMDGQTMGELAQALYVKPPTITKMVTRLALHGLVERRASKDDARQWRIFLTPAGTLRAEEIDLVWRRLEKQTLSRLDTRERKRLRRLLRQVGRNLGLDGAMDRETMDTEPADGSSEPGED